MLEQDKSRIIKKNLLPEYVRALSVQHFTNVESLKTVCKNLEAGFIEAEKYFVVRKSEPEPVVRNVRPIRPSVNVVDSPAMSVDTYGQMNRGGSQYNRNEESNSNNQSNFSNGRHYSANYDRRNHYDNRSRDFRRGSNYPMNNRYRSNLN